MTRAEVYLLFGVLFVIMLKLTPLDGWLSITSALIEIVGAFAYFIAAIRAKGESK